ncbi:MAG TPA: penicillin-binding protein activator [Arenimonas sp.]|nr:penicillin-binding protein activator [Arenimonas sp.]
MRVLIATTALCLLAACGSTPKKAPGIVQETVQKQSPLDEARAQNRHFMSPALIDGFPAGTDPNYRPPARLAVLLPQSGSLAAAGTAIRDGILAGYYAESRTKPTIRFYNSQGSAEGAKAAYQRALKDGAQMILGPIGKEEVAAIAETASGIPVLALNHIDQPGNRVLLNFSLNPEREGELLAERLIGKSLLQAGVFNQGGDGNARTLAAFEKRYQQAGGKILFRAPAPQFGKDANGAPVNPVLPESLLQAKAIMLLMSGTAAKPTRAALALNGASAIPVFAGSEITENGDAKTNAQLNGIEFMQIPWLANQGNALGVTPAQLSKLPSARGGGARLNAFGLDAWLVSTRLQVWLGSPNTAINGATGTLHMEPDGQIERKLPWLTFQNGQPQPVNDSQP